MIKFNHIKTFKCQIRIKIISVLLRLWKIWLLLVREEIFLIIGIHLILNYFNI